MAAGDVSAGCFTAEGPAGRCNQLQCSWVGAWCRSRSMISTCNVGPYIYIEPSETIGKNRMMMISPMQIWVSWTLYGCIKPIYEI